MPIISDCHLHTSYSADSEAPMEDMVKAAIAKGLKTICITEHNDFAMPVLPDYPPEAWAINVYPYLYDLAILKGTYADKIRILFGIELGFQEKCLKEDEEFAGAYDFDFIIGSTHIVRGMDPYYPEYFEGRDEEDAFHEYFEDELKNIKLHSNFDVYGHLDYVVRYSKDPSKPYDYSKHAELFDEILKTLIDKGKGIELNTGGMKKGMKEFHPCKKLLKRYRELGGEILTIGSDAHDPSHVADYYDLAEDYLKECGFKYYTIFDKRVPEFIKL